MQVQWVATTKTNQSTAADNLLLLRNDEARRQSQGALFAAAIALILLFVGVVRARYQLHAAVCLLVAVSESNI